MLNVWDKSKIDIYFDDVELDVLVRQGFNNLIEEVSGEEITTFVETINSLYELPAVHAIVTESQRYII